MDENKTERTLKFGKVMAQSYKTLGEETYDDKDNYLEAVTGAFGEEFKLFLVELVKNFHGQFAWSFATPKSELFGKSWKELQDKYQLMDDAGKEDLYIKIGLFMRRFFLDMFPWAGEKGAIAMADVFKKMMIERLRDKQIQARKV